MTTENQSGTNNGYLNALWILGGVLTVIGGIVWLANSSDRRDGGEGDLVAQAVGGSILGAGVSFIALGLVAAAICLQIRQSDRG